MRSEEGRMWARLRGVGASRSHRVRIRVGAATYWMISSGDWFTTAEIAEVELETRGSDGNPAAELRPLGG